MYEKIIRLFWNFYIIDVIFVTFGRWVIASAAILSHALQQPPIHPLNKVVIFVSWLGMNMSAIRIRLNEISTKSSVWIYDEIILQLLIIFKSCAWRHSQHLATYYEGHRLNYEPRT